MAYLEVQDLNVFYGGIQALRSVNFSVERTEIIAIIGANGAGKSTLMRSIAGDQKYKGSIIFDGAPLPPDAYQVVTKGISLVPEGRRIFPGLTVLENLKIGAYARKDRNKISEDLDEVFELFPRLKERTKQMGGSLSGGEQQMLAVARAMLANPKMLLLDEPTLGLAPIIIDELFNIFHMSTKNQGKSRAKRSRCRSSQEITCSPTPFSALYCCFQVFALSIADINAIANPTAACLILRNTLHALSDP